jgi:hypothetical protein
MARARAITVVSTQSTSSFRAIDSPQSIGTVLVEHPPFSAKHSAPMRQAGLLA